MNERIKFLVPLLVALGALALVYYAVYKPALLNDYRVLGGLVFLQVLMVTLWDYRHRFFPFLILAFLWAGTDLPLRGVWTTGRWFVLGAGAIVGAVISLRDQRHRFGMFHLVAFGCVLAAAVSAIVSNHPQLALLKVVSLFLLFLYGSAGARLAVVGREVKFFSGLLFGCELLVYVTLVGYFVLRNQFFGNPNSLGLVMGVVVTPILLWGVFVSDRRSVRSRRIVALMLCLFLLLSSYARAGFAAAAVSSTLLCFGLRQYRIFVKGLIVVFASAAVVAAFVPVSTSVTSDNNSVFAHFLYKGQPEAGLFGSRSPVWDRTVASLQQHPWFGTGFGTSETNAEANEVSPTFSSGGVGSREHGTSYLEIIEWVGLLGVAPFLVLLLLLVINVARVVNWMRETRSPFSPAVPIAVFVAGALVHAGFEDWLFAMGYHTCVFFWSIAFVLPDLLPATLPRYVYPSSNFDFGHRESSLGVAASSP